MSQQPQPDWLDNDALDSARAKLDGDALEFAKLYLVFETHPVAKQLLEHWVTTTEMMDIPANAPHPVYAYYEGRRAFVRGIRRLIAKAKQDSTT